MLGFIVGGLIFTVTFGRFLSLLITTLIGLEGKKKAIIAIILALALGFGLSKAILLEVETENKRWNNGICTECGGKYEFQSSSYKKNANDEYYYKCKNCGYVIELSSLRNN